MPKEESELQTDHNPSRPSDARTPGIRAGFAGVVWTFFTIAFALLASQKSEFPPVVRIGFYCAAVISALFGLLWIGVWAYHVISRRTGISNRRPETSRSGARTEQAQPAPALADRREGFDLFRDITELVLSDVALLVFFVVTWISPFAIGQRAPHACMAIFLMEFITVHSTTFLIVFSGSRKAGLIALLYIPFVALAGVIVRAIWPITMFAWHVYGSVSAFRGDSDTRRNEAIVRWAICFALFVLCLGLAAMFPWPDLGWGEETTPEFAWSRGTGEILYHVTPAWGTLYFLGLTVADALLLKRRHSRAETNRPNGSLIP